MICGNCKNEHSTVQEVKDCYSTGSVLTKAPEVGGFAQKYIESRDFKPMAVAEEPTVIPASCYSLESDKGLLFYEVQNGKGKWKGYQFLTRLIGHPGSWLQVPVKGTEKSSVMAQIRQNPLEAARRYSTEFTCCAVCGSPLSDPESIARGMGPVCIARF